MKLLKAAFEENRRMAEKNRPLTIFTAGPSAKNRAPLPFIKAVAENAGRRGGAGERGVSGPSPYAGETGDALSLSRELERQMRRLPRTFIQEEENAP